METQLAAWRDEISNASNTHETRICQLEEKIAPRLIISETALGLAVWLTETSEDGLRSQINFDDLQAAFMETDKGTLQEACHELKYLELVTLTATLSCPERLVHPSYNLFWTFDPYIVGTDPTKDAVEIANLMVTDKSLGNIRKLDNKLKWPRRRLNPAVARLIPLFADGHVSKEIQNIYPTNYFSIGSEDRFNLKRFIDEAAIPE